MKLSEAIFQADVLRPNAVMPELKVRWLLQLEAEIAELMGVELEVASVDDDTELLMPDPYSNIYPLYLCPYIDWAQQETDLYQIDTIESNTALEEAKKWWVRNNDVSAGKDRYFTGVFY